MNVKVILPMQNFRKSCVAFKELWKNYDLKAVGLNRIPSDDSIECLFYSYHGFDSQNDVRTFMQENNDFVWFSPTVRETQFNLVKLKSEIERLLPNSEKDLILGLILFVEKTVFEAKDIVSQLGLPKKEFEVIEAKKIAGILSGTTRVILEYSDFNRSVKEDFIAGSAKENIQVTLSNIEQLYCESLTVDLSDKLYSIDIKEGLHWDFKLLSCLIANVGFAGGSWLITVDKKYFERLMESDLVLFNNIKSIQDISDGIIYFKKQN